MSEFKGFTFDSGDGHVGKKGDRFKAETDTGYRFSFISWPGLAEKKPDLDAAGPDFKGVSTNYIDKVGYVINKGPEFTKIAGNKQPRLRIGTVVVVWPTNKDGVLDPARVQNGEFEVKYWLFSDSKYKSLKMSHKEFHFGKHDLTLNCSDSKYQKLTFSPCKDNLFRKLYESEKGSAIVAEIMDKAQKLMDNLENELGLDYTIEEIQKAIAEAGGLSGTGVAGNPDAAVTGDIDDIVGGLLDD